MYQLIVLRFIRRTLRILSFPHINNVFSLQVLVEMTFNRKVENALVAEAAGAVVPVRRRSSIPRKMLAGILAGNETAPVVEDSKVHVEKMKAEKVPSNLNFKC